MLRPVEQLGPGDTLVLPSGREVTVERVDHYDEAGDMPAQYVVRWWRKADRGEPGYRHDASVIVGGVPDGRYLGSCVPVPVGHCWQVAPC